MKKLILVFLFFGIALNNYAQNVTTDDLWTKSPILKSASADVLPTESKPAKFDLYNLNLPCWRASYFLIVPV